MWSTHPHNKILYYTNREEGGGGGSQLHILVCSKIQTLSSCKQLIQDRQISEIKVIATWLGEGGGLRYCILCVLNIYLETINKSKMPVVHSHVALREMNAIIECISDEDR